MNTERHIPAVGSAAVENSSPATAPRIEHDYPTVTGIPIAERRSTERRTNGRRKSYLELSEEIAALVGCNSDMQECISKLESEKQHQAVLIASMERRIKDLEALLARADELLAKASRSGKRVAPAKVTDEWPESDVDMSSVVPSRSCLQTALAPKATGLPPTYVWAKPKGLLARIFGG